MTPDDGKAVRAFGLAISRLRSERGLTQEALAYKISLTVSQLSRIERGKANPKWGTVVRFAAGLGVTTVDLARREEEIRVKLPS